MKIVILDGYTTNPGDLSYERFSNFGELAVYDYTAPDEVAERCLGAEIVISNKTLLPRETLEKLKSVKYIGLLSTGYNVVDVSAASHLGITVTHVPTYGTEAVAQHTFALLLELTNNAALHSDAVHAGEWSDKRKFCFWKQPLEELSGKTFGVIGYGRIGRRAADIARAFGMQVVFASRSTVSDTPDLQVSVDDLFKMSDVVSLHCPLNELTQNIICKNNLKKMKPTAFVINTSRGGAVNEAELADALNSELIAGAAVDVLSSEPPCADNPLLHAKNCVITPHIAWAAFETRERLIDLTFENMVAFLQGEPINTVN